MSELEVRQARMEVERNTVEFEKALDSLLEQIHQSTETIGRLTDKTKDITNKVREIVDVDGLIERAKKSAVRMVSEIRVAAEGELATFDSRPLVTWGTVLFSGLTLGYILARKRLAAAKTNGLARFLLRGAVA